MGIPFVTLALKQRLHPPAPLRLFTFYIYTHKMMIFLGFMLLSATQASPMNPTASPTNLTASPSNVELKSWNSSSALMAAAMVAESSLASAPRCSLRAFCTAATKHSHPHGSMEKGVADTYQILNEVVKSVPEGETVLGRMSQLKTSFELGFETEDEQICKDIYECDTAEQDTAEKGKQGRDGLKCHQTNAACPGVAIGCTLCGMVLPGVCGSTCTPAGFFCFLSGGLCFIEAQ